MASYLEPSLGEEALQVGASQVHHRIELLYVDSPPPALREGAAKVLLFKRPTQNNPSIILNTLTTLTCPTSFQ